MSRTLSSLNEAKEAIDEMIGKVAADQKKAKEEALKNGAAEQMSLFDF